MSQKGGAGADARAHRRRRRERCTRRASSGADLLLGCDLLVAAAPEALLRVRRGPTRAVRQHRRGDHRRVRAPPGDGVSARGDAGAAARGARGRRQPIGFVDADASCATRCWLGHSIATNMFLLGFAWQRGLVPVGRAALLRAVELNGVAAADNARAFAWGRRAAADPARAPSARLQPRGAAAVAAPVGEPDERSGAGARISSPTRARRWRGATRRSSSACAAPSSSAAPGSERLTLAVARQAHRLFAYKDEYEVARLYSDPAFGAALAATFEGDCQVRLHLALPWQRQAPTASRASAASARGCGARCACWRTAGSCAARRSIPSPGPPSGGSSARSRPSTRPPSSACCAGSMPRGSTRRSRSPNCRRSIRGFGPVKRRNASGRARAAEGATGRLRGRRIRRSAAGQSGVKLNRHDSRSAGGLLSAHCSPSRASALWWLQRGAAGGARQGLMLWRSALRADSTAMLDPRSRRRTHCVRFVLSVQTTATSQSTKRAARADPRPALLVATEIAPTGHRPPRSSAVVFQRHEHHRPAGSGVVNGVNKNSLNGVGDPTSGCKRATDSNGPRAELRGSVLDEVHLARMTR